MAMNPWVDINWAKWGDAGITECMLGVKDNINKPKHYNQYGIECIDAIKASMSLEQFRGYLKGNCEKYIWRKDYKGNAVEDLKKCRWYLDKLIESHEKEV